MCGGCILVLHIRSRCRSSRLGGWSRRAASGEQIGGVVKSEPEEHPSEMPRSAYGLLRVGRDARELYYANIASRCPTQ